MIIAKIAAPKFLDPRSKYALFSGCSLPESTKNKKTQSVYMLECVSKGYYLLCNGHIDEQEFGKLVKKSSMTRRILEEITDGSWGICFSHCAVFFSMSLIVSIMYLLRSIILS